jgi:hypothetical protein
MPRAKHIRNERRQRPRASCQRSERPIAITDRPLVARYHPFAQLDIALLYHHVKRIAVTD